VVNAGSSMNSLGKVKWGKAFRGKVFWFKCADRNTWMSLTDGNHVMYCIGQDS